FVRVVQRPASSETQFPDTSSLAMFTTIVRASSLMSNLAAERSRSGFDAQARPVGQSRAASGPEICSHSPDAASGRRKCLVPHLGKAAVWPERFNFGCVRNCSMICAVHFAILL